MFKKNISLFILLAGLSCCTFAQIQHPIKWAYATRLCPPERNQKPNTRIYEVYFKATIESTWHIYAQKQPDNSVSQPTVITIKDQEGLTLIGKPKELGKLVNFIDSATGIEANEYANSVEFVQLVKIRNNIIKSLSVRLVFQACTDHMCLSPDSLDITVPMK